MEFIFDAHQEFQLKAVESVINLFQGQTPVEPDLSFSFDGGFAAISNKLDIDENLILSNLKKVQNDSGIPSDDSLIYIEEEIDTAEGRKKICFPNFSVEMETGTGKTYVYLRTILELFKAYGQRKFIIVVPNVAIREGVLKTLKMTKKHFVEQYENTPYRFNVYDSSKLTLIRQFALSDSIEIMIMTIDSFNKAANVIRLTTDRLQGETPIHLIQETRPILILDEPQNMESEKSISALALLNPLFALRYSATHRNPYNLIYRLTPYDAYRKGLVKKIEVASVVKKDDFNKVFIRVEEIKTEKRTVTAKLSLHKLMKSGAIKEAVVKVKPGDSLVKKTGRNEYEGYGIDEINPGYNSVIFDNGLELEAGQSCGADKDAIFKAQIEYTINTHIKKQEKLRSKGIKVLSLFFIDRVSNYQGKSGEEGIIRKIFDESFNTIKKSYPEWLCKKSDEVQAAYFAKKKIKTGEIVFQDSVTGKSQKDEETYNLIMKDKERLLSFDEPVSFIFSHSALREGWDNPNVFQICTLNQTVSEVKKRQEVGRGVRLAVDNTGKRIFDDGINNLTVVANESYEKYVERLQSEIEEEYGREGLPPKPANARERKSAILRKEYLLRPEFRDLWEKIKHKTRYAVLIDTEKLVNKTVEKLNSVEIKPSRITISKAKLNVEIADSLKVIQLMGEKTFDEVLPENRGVDLIGLIIHHLEFTSPPITICKNTIIKILNNITSNQKVDSFNNPTEFALVFSQIIRSNLADILVDGIQYTRINEWYEMTQFESEIESWDDYLEPADRSLYDQVCYDSEVEKEFINGLDSRDDVRLFIKLPHWFTVPTPVGEYNPDWAIVLEDRDVYGNTGNRPLLYLVRETKDTTDIEKLRPDEKRKVICGKKHFSDALEVDYKVVTDIKELI